MVIARGIEGEVGILSGHAPLLVRLAVGPLRIQNGDVEDRAVVDGGFLHVASEGDATRVDVLASHAELEHEIDVERERRRKEEAERCLQERDDAECRAELAKALARLNLRGQV